MLSERDNKILASRYEIFPLATLGGKMQKDVFDTYERAMAKKDRYTRMDPKISNNAWIK